VTRRLWPRTRLTPELARDRFLAAKIEGLEARVTALEAFELRLTTLEHRAPRYFTDGCPKDLCYRRDCAHHNLPEAQIEEAFNS